MTRILNIVLMCVLSYCDSYGDVASASAKYDIAISEKNESFSRDGVRSISRLFFRVLEIAKKESLSRDEKARFLTKALKHYEDVYNDKGAWTGEHAESGDDDLNKICELLGDQDLYQLLARPDFNLVLKMFKARPPECIKRFKITKEFVDRQRLVNVPLFDYK